MCSDAPDNTGINEAAVMNAELAKDTADYYRERDAALKPLVEAASRRADEVSLAQLEGMRTATRIANDADQYNRETFRPLEREIVADARSYDTQARRDEAVGKAVGDVTLAGARARDMEHTSMSRMGINPADGAYGAGATMRENAITLAQAGAANKARTQVESTGRALKADAAAMGRGLPGVNATQQQIALSSGNSAVGNAQVPVSLANAQTSQMGQGFGQAGNLSASSGNLYGQAAQLSKSNNDGLWSALGNVAGAGIMMYSDKNMKKDRKPVKTEIALAAARSMPVDKWKYKAGSAGDDGGKEHIGPMAQDVHAALGDAAAPGGKMVDPYSLVNVTLAAVQELDKRQAKLEKKVLRLADTRARA